MTQPPEVWSAPSQHPNFGPQDIPERVAHAGNLPPELGGERPVVEDVTPLTPKTPIDIPQDTRSITWKNSEAEAPSVSVGAGQKPEGTNKGRGLSTKAKAAIGASLAAAGTLAGVLVATSGNSNNTAPRAVASASPSPEAPTTSPSTTPSVTESNSPTTLPSVREVKYPNEGNINVTRLYPNDITYEVPLPDGIHMAKLPELRNPQLTSPTAFAESFLANLAALDGATSDQVAETIISHMTQNPATADQLRTIRQPFVDYLKGGNGYRAIDVTFEDSVQNPANFVLNAQPDGTGYPSVSLDTSSSPRLFERRFASNGSTFGRGMIALNQQLLLGLTIDYSVQDNKTWVTSFETHYSGLIPGNSK